MFKSIDEAVFVAYLSPTDGWLKTAFESLGARNRDRFSFGITSNVRLADLEGVGVPSIVCYKPTEGEREIFSDEWGWKALEAFVETATAPLIGEFTRRNEIKYLRAGKSLIYTFYTSASERAHYQSLLKPLAKKYKEYINFVTIDAVEYAHMAPGLGLEPREFPALVLQNPMFGQVFPFESRRAMSVEEVERWVLNIVAGQVLPWSREDVTNAASVVRKDEL